MADDPSSSQPKKHVHTRKQQTQHIRARFQTTVETRTDEIDKYKENEEVQTKLETDNPTADLPVESLFALHRLKYPLSSNTFLFFFLWTPFGIPIFLFRVSVIGVVLIFFYTCAAIPYLEKLRFVCPKLFVNVVFPICGLWHTVRGRENKNAVHIDKCIFVSNHLSNFDPIWFNAIFSDFTLLCAGDYDWFWEAMKRIGVLTRDDEHGKGCIYTRYFGTGQEREEVRIAIEEDMARVDARPFLIYPEGESRHLQLKISQPQTNPNHPPSSHPLPPSLGCVTNGYAAVMQYQKFVFGLNKVIVPVCLQFVNPWPFEHYCLSTGAANHLMWYMFSPFVIMKHAILPPQKIRKDESPAFFALRIQAMTAAHLGLGVIRLNWKQKDRLAQAMGFQPYSENFWSRRESMDDFKKAVYDNALVVQGDKIVKTASRKEEERSEKTSFHGRINRFGSVVKRRAVAQQKEAAFMAKEFAAKHNNGRDSELQILDDQMKKLQAQQRARSILPGRNHNRKVSLISPDLNAELVEKINEVSK